MFSMSVSSEQRRLAAIMFTDMVGYSALAQRDQALALDLLEKHREILRSIFPRFNGTEIKTIGDAFLVEFNSALEAAQCAIEIQRTLAKHNADAPADRQIQVRIGIHIGDVVHREGDVYGDGVNIASRIQPVAGVGGICISMDVERQIHNALEVTFEKLARTELKNIQVPMDLFRIVLPWERQIPVAGQRRAVVALSQKPRARALVTGTIAAILLLIIGIGWWWTTLPHARRAAAQSGSINVPAKSIAVLPFTNLSRDPDNAYFAAGIQDEIITRLSKIAELKVISCTSTQRFKSSPDDIPAIAAQLGVANILEGSVQRTADAVRVNVQLIRGATDTHLWADTFDRKLTDIFAVESEISKTIAATLQAKLTGSEQNAIAARPTDNTEAYQLYLKGRFFWNKRTGQNLNKAADYFNQAIAADPGYALAYVGLADSYLLMPLYGAGAPQDCYPKAKAASEKALQLDNVSAEAHTSRAQIFCYYDLDFPRAIQEFQRAIELNPNYPTAHQWYGSSALAAVGRFDEAITEVKRAIELDPLSLVINTDMGNTYYRARRYDEAIDQMRKTVEMDPGFYYVHWNLGSALAAKGNLSAAIEEYLKARALNDDPSLLGLLAHAYAVSGNKSEAIKIRDQLEALAKQRYVSAYTFTLVYLALGDKEEALRRLEKAYQNRAGDSLRFIKVEPLLDALHGDPRFDALAEKIVPAREFGKSQK
jgi:adenylate cyclase